MTQNGNYGNNENNNNIIAQSCNCRACKALAVLRANGGRTLPITPGLHNSAYAIIFYQPISACARVKGTVNGRILTFGVPPLVPHIFVFAVRRFSLTHTHARIRFITVIRLFSIFSVVPSAAISVPFNPTPPTRFANNIVSLAATIVIGFFPYDACQSGRQPTADTIDWHATLIDPATESDIFFYRYVRKVVHIWISYCSQNDISNRVTRVVWSWRFVSFAVPPTRWCPTRASERDAPRETCTNSVVSVRVQRFTVVRINLSDQCWREERKLPPRSHNTRGRSRIRYGTRTPNAPGSCLLLYRTLIFAAEKYIISNKTVKNVPTTMLTFSYVSGRLTYNKSAITSAPFLR